MARSRFDTFCDELTAEFPSFRLFPKESSPLMRALYRALQMRFWNREFLTHYTTVIATRVYMPESLIGTEQGYRTLRHERVHMRDARRTGFFPFAFSYLFLFPSVVTARAYWELRAYAETMRVELEETGDISEDTIEFIAERFVGSDYLFMCPFPRFVRGRLHALRERLLASWAGAARGRATPRPHARA
jgi:hypothetical protein